MAAVTCRSHKSATRHCSRLNNGHLKNFQDWTWQSFYTWQKESCTKPPQQIILDMSALSMAWESTVQKTLPLPLPHNLSHGLIALQTDGVPAQDLSPTTLPRRRNLLKLLLNLPTKSCSQLFHWLFHPTLSFCPQISCTLPHALLKIFHSCTSVSGGKITPDPWNKQFF